MHLPKCVTMLRALCSSALTWLVDCRWGWEILYKHKITSLRTTLHCSVKCKRYECPDFYRGHITVNAAWPMQTSVPFRANSCLNLKCGWRRHVDGMTQLRNLQRHSEAKLSSILHRNAPLNVLTMWRALFSSALAWLVDGRWGREVLYKHKLTSFTTALHCSVKFKRYECPDFCKGHITINAAQPRQMSDYQAAPLTQATILHVGKLFM
jgi:hypothetical protein